ncbi:MAG TPA: DUF4397 domain-containing protein [Bryobacteraceae bacterium]
MFRLLKVLPVALAIAAVVALGLIAASCGNGGNAQVRVVNAIPDNGSNGDTAVDVYVNGTKDFPNVAFPQVYPNQPPPGPAHYTSVPSGSVTFQAYDAGTTTPPIFGEGVTGNLSAAAHYTALLGGYLTGSTVYVIPDNNTLPKTGYLNLRVIDGSAVAGLNGLDLYIYQTGLNPPSTATVSGLALGSSSGYLSLTFETQYSIDVYFHNNQNKLFTIPVISGGSDSSGSITTVVIVDQPGGNAISNIPTVMYDLV